VDEKTNLNEVGDLRLSNGLETVVQVVHVRSMVLFVVNVHGLGVNEGLDCEGRQRRKKVKKKKGKRPRGEKVRCGTRKRRQKRRNAKEE
jgi:uncharacterized protein related to proFAR isomerase